MRSQLPVALSDVLDVGTGTGLVARIVAALGHHVTAIDLAAGMLKVARERTALDHLDVHFLLGDAVSPPFAPASFDVVISRSVIWTLREPDAAFRNWFALLRAGGRVVAIYGLRTAEPPDSGAPTEDQRTEFIEQYYTPETRAALPGMTLRHHEPLVELANEAGFVEIRVTPLDMVTGEETSPASQLPYVLVGHRR